MTETTTTTVSNGSTNKVEHPPSQANHDLAIWSLKTVTWLEMNPVLKDGYKIAERQTAKVRQYRIVQAIFTIILFQLSLVDIVVRTLPWPAWVVSLVHRLDDVVEGSLEYVYRTLEWWFDCISIRLLRLLETVGVYLDKCLTAIDSNIEWLAKKYEWALAIIVKVYERVLAVWKWYVSLWVSAWAALRSGVHSTQQMWALSQEELLRTAKEEENRKTEAAAQVAAPPKPTPRLRVSSTSSTEKRLSFSGVDEWEEGCSSGGRISPMPSRSPGHRGSDSEGSDVAAVQETRKFLVGEQTGRSYSRVDTSATVVGRQREAMYERVTAKLQIMRKNSIRFSRGIDVRVSRLIATAQGQFTPRSLMSFVLSIVKFFILAPFKVIMWVVGAKHLSRRSRSMRQESLRRRKAAEAAAAGLTPPLGPAVFKDSGEVAPNLPQLPVSGVTDELKEGESAAKLGGRDSGISEDIPDFSEDSNGSTTSSVAKTNESASNIFAKSDKYMSISSTSTISEEPDEDEDNASSRITTPPPSPVRSSNLTIPRMKKKLSAHDAKFSTRPSSSTSEPDLTSILLTQEAKRKSLGSLPDEFAPLASKRTKKRVSIQYNAHESTSPFSNTLH